MARKCFPLSRKFLPQAFFFNAKRCPAGSGASLGPEFCFLCWPQRLPAQGNGTFSFAPSVTEGKFFWNAPAPQFGVPAPLRGCGPLTPGPVGALFLPVTCPMPGCRYPNWAMTVVLLRHSVPRALGTCGDCPAPKMPRLSCRGMHLNVLQRLAPPPVLLKCGLKRKPDAKVLPPRPLS